MPDAIEQLKAHYRRLDGNDDIAVGESSLVSDGRLIAHGRKAT